MVGATPGLAKMVLFDKQSEPGLLLVPLWPTTHPHECGGSLHPSPACAHRALPISADVLVNRGSIT